MKSLNKKSATAISLILISTIAMTLFAIPTTNAHSPPWNYPSFAYLVPAPNPVGVGQKVSIVMWVDEPLPNAAVTNDIRRHDYTLTILKPDGKTVTEHWDSIMDTTSIQYYSYVPDLAGTYNLKFEYGGQTYTWSGTNQNDTYAPASKSIDLIVQEEQLPAPVTSYPLPTEYWARPIEGQNTDWYLVSSNWLGAPYLDGAGDMYATQGTFQPDGIAPNSPHIMWSKPIQDGGVVGGNGYHTNGTNYYMGGSYNVRFGNALIMFGRLYYQEPYGNSGSGGDYVCVDLRTGMENWRINTTGIGVPSFGYLYDYDMYNQHGVIPEGWLFTNNFARAYDPSTGIVSNLNLTNVPSGTAVIGPAGEILRYQWSSTSRQLAEWNSSNVFVTQTSGKIPANCPIVPARSGSTYWNGSTWVSSTERNAQGYSSVTTAAYDWNITLSGLGSGSWSVNRVNYNDIMLLTQGSLGDKGSWAGANITAVSLKPESRGTLLWTKSYPPAPGNVSRSIAAWDPKAGVFVTHDTETLVFNGWNLASGEHLWGPTEPTNDYTYFRGGTHVAYGKIYYSGYGGVLYCYDIKTGNKLWTYGNGGEGNSTSSGLGTAWGNYPTFVDVIADDKVYLATTEHSPNSPYYKDTKYRCVNATTGEEIWTLMGWGTGMDAAADVLADGFFVFLNCYDMQIYSIGKGPSALKVEAPSVGVELGKSLVIRGTVTDVSAGTEQDVIARRFPNGVPAMSDASMEGWMEYVYMQKPKPKDAIGVPVTIDVIDSNNNYRNIGTATSDASGMFTFSWTPDIEGDFKVVATFAGSESYWPSSAETSFVVDPTTPPTQTPEYPQPIDNTMTIVGVGAALLIAIAIVGAVIVLMLRKRP